MIKLVIYCMFSIVFIVKYIVLNEIESFVFKDDILMSRNR